MSTANNAKGMTGEQIADAFSRAIRHSDKEDTEGGLEIYARRWDRLNTFVTALASEFCGVTPGLYMQLTGFQLRVVDDENSLRKAYEIAEGNKK